MEDGHKILQQQIRFHRRDFVVGRLLHVAIDDLPLLIRLEQFVAWFRGFQRFVRELTGLAVQDAPVVGIGSERIHLLKLKVFTTGFFIVDDIVCTGIAENLCQIVLATHGMPVAVVHLAAGDGGLKVES